MPVKAKAITAKMKKQIAKAAKGLGIAAPDFSDGGGKTYETWVLLELASRVRPTLVVSARDHTGAPTIAFRVRGGPGYMPPAASPASGEPCHFLLQGQHRSAELHSSLRHRGSSGDTHELDISAVDAGIADHVRNSGGGPFPAVHFGRAEILGAELKEYDGVKSLPKVYPRALVGVAVDLEPYAHVLVERRRRAHVVQFVGIDFWLLTTTTLGTSGQLLDHHDISWRANVEPGPHESRLQDVADQLTRRLA
jgi:hypothetical protein